MSAAIEQMNRRAFLRALALVGVALLPVSRLLGDAAYQVLARAGGQPASAATLADTDLLPPPGRFFFRGQTRRGDEVQANYLQEFWAHPQYVRVVTARATYRGPEPFVLTPSEQTVVDVALKAGAEISNQNAYYLTVLTACTRIAPAELRSRLDALGVPGVEAALTLAPFAPQATRLRRWLDQQVR